MSIASNLKSIREQMAAAALKVRRDPTSVRLIAVSKTKPLALIREAFDAGQSSFGENYVQEAVEKVEEFPQAEWHFIGSLQTNKAKQVVGKFALIHSVDRAKLADELEKVASQKGIVQDILVQIHIGDEETKHGAGLDDAPALIEHISKLPHLRMRGIMSLPPLSENESVSRGYFASLRAGFEKWRSQLPREQASHFTELSMGTSSDFESAILEGATMVRVGTSIFGARERH